MKTISHAFILAAFILKQQGYTSPITTVGGCGYGRRNHGNVVVSFLIIPLYSRVLVGKYTEAQKLQEQLP